eukprot:jgi/Psemu1/303893/fgenesh1_kg.127_\
MKIAQPVLRRLVALSRPRSFAGVIGSASGSVNPSFFCTGTTPDMPLSAVATTPNNFSNVVGNRSFSSKATLLELLAREEQEEVETGNTEMPTELSDLKNTIEKSWKIVEDGATTNFFKIENSSGNKIQVSFHCQDTL